MKVKVKVTVTVNYYIDIDILNEVYFCRCECNFPLLLYDQLVNEYAIVKPD